jgi:hypothetical protein
MDGPALFADTSRRFLSGEISPDEAIAILDSIDFTLFSFDEMVSVEDSDWIPDEAFVRIVRSWIAAQESNLSQIRSYLALTATVSRDLLLAFVDAIFEPRRSLSLAIDGVIYHLATGAGTREYTNPMELKLISASSDAEMPIMPHDPFAIKNMFANDRNKFFQSQPKTNVQFIVGLPPFLQVAATAYTIRAPAKTGSMRSWTLEGSVDRENWTDLDNVVDNNDLAAPGAERTFELARRGPFCRWFRVTQKNLNHEKNLTVRISNFDVNGEVKLVPN